MRVLHFLLSPSPLDRFRRDVRPACRRRHGLLSARQASQPPRYGTRSWRDASPTVATCWPSKPETPRGHGLISMAAGPCALSASGDVQAHITRGHDWYSSCILYGQEERMLRTLTTAISLVLVSGALVLAAQDTPSTNSRQTTMSS